MGAAEPSVGERDDHESASLRPKQIRATNTGVCMEECHPESISLHLGCGDIRWDGWIGIDVGGNAADVKSDIRKLEFPTDHADRIAAVHVVEHFYRWEIQDILREWLRVLKPGGKLILELPCLDKVFAYITRCVRDGTPMSPTFSWFPLWGDPKYGSVEMTHKWGYTFKMLKEELVKAGFRDVKYMKPFYHFPDRDMRLEASK